MRYFRLPNCEARVSSIGLGAMRLCVISLEHANDVVRACLNAGITFFECGAGYRTSEWKIGRALGHDRRRVVVASKSRERSKAGILRHVRTSMLRLDTDYIDIYQCHYVNKRETLNEILANRGAVEGLIQARDRGYVRQIGITGHSVDVMLEAIERFSFDTVQMPHNAVNSFNLPALKQAQETGALAIGNKPFMAGQLLKYGLSPGRLVSVLEREPCPDVVIVGVSAAEQVEALFPPGGARGLGPTKDELFPMANGQMRAWEYPPCPHGVPVEEMLHAHDILTHYDNDSTKQALFLSLLKKAAAIEVCRKSCECDARDSCALALGNRIDWMWSRMPHPLF